MRRMLAIYRKELHMYFYSPIAYVAFAFYFLLTSIFFVSNFLNPPSVIDIRPLFANITIVYLFVIPLLTMRLVSDEFKQGTDELLLTSPAGIGEIIVGKYIAALTVQILLVGGSLIYPLIMSRFGSLDQPVLWLSYLSIFLLGAAMMAVGLFASTLSSHQMVSGMIGFGLILVLWMMDWLGSSVYSNIKDILAQFSIIGRTASFQKGVFDLSDLIFYVMFVALFLVFSTLVLERKRWR